MRTAATRRSASARLTPYGLGDVHCLAVKEHWNAGFQRPIRSYLLADEVVKWHD
jgi:hypothetical protein